MFAVLFCITQGHDLRLVAVAALICAIACGAAFGFHQRALKSEHILRWAWAALTGLVAGCGVWATHFTAMLAYQPSLAIQYEVLATVASLVIAVVGMGAGFAVPVHRPTRAGALIGGAFTGFSVAAMHFTGIAAVRAEAHILWDVPYVVAAIVISIFGAMAAFDLRYRLKGGRAVAAPAVGLVLSIVGLHFTAMTAVILRPDPTIVLPEAAIGRGALAVMTIALAGVILGAAASLVWIERLGRRSTLSGLRQALDAAPMGLAFYDPDDRLIARNQTYAALLGDYGVAAAPGVTRDALIQGAAAAGWLDHDDEPITSRVGAGLATELKLPDGRWLRYEDRRTQDGGRVTVLTDITDQKETARQLAAARDSAEAASRAKTAFLANISHEIRTPMNGVLGIADLLNASRLNSHQRRLVGVIRESGAHLNAILADLLDLARIEAGEAELRPERASIGEVMTSLRDLYAPQATAKGLTLTADLAPGAELDVVCDPVRLRQVLGNLVSNAIKFTETGEVVLSATRDGEALRFEVRDTGPGFDESEKESLVKGFSQADATSTRRHGGAGLGLAICNRYVRLMGSTLECASRSGEGAVFGFVLHAPALEPLPQPEAEEEACFPAGQGFRVLVVDDNAVNRQLLQLILDSAEVEHSAAVNGQEAVEAMMSGGFDAVFMDIQMPVMDGFEATRRIREWERAAGRPRAPIYIVSANCLKEHVEAGRAAGADGHLNKPVSVQEILETLAPHVSAGRLAA